MCTDQPSVTQRDETTFRVWKTIKLGTGIKDADGFRVAIKAMGMCVHDYAYDILSEPAFTVADEQQEVDLVVVSIRDLGFEKEATQQEIYQRALEKGLQLCPNEVGPQLRLQYADQPLNESIVIGMEPIIGSDHDFKLFRLTHSISGAYLQRNCGYPDGLWNINDNRFVFVRPRK
jgi:hypothetical protein